MNHSADEQEEIKEMIEDESGNLQLVPLNKRQKQESMSAGGNGLPLLSSPLAAHYCWSCHHLTGGGNSSALRKKIETKREKLTKQRVEPISFCPPVASCLT